MKSSRNILIDNQKYTLYGINEIDNKISNDLKLIVDNVVRLLGKENIHSIILTGSFGKGEGGAFLHDGKVKVINDYDISIKRRGVCMPSNTKTKKNGDPKSITIYTFSRCSFYYNSNLHKNLL